MTASASRRFLAPEVIQTSGMDCGPASLKCLLEGFRIPVSYGRLREACQTDVDGTSIDTMEEIAVQLGLDAEQVIIPRDHLFIPESQALPCLIVVRLPNGNIHFVILWGKHGPIAQIMDPATGRRWVNVQRFLDEVFIHQLAVEETAWREWVGSAEFLDVLRNRLNNAGLSAPAIDRLVQAGLDDEGWRTLAALDASTRMVESLIGSNSLKRGAQSAQVLEGLVAEALTEAAGGESLIPTQYWMVRPAPPDEKDNPQLMMRGVVLVRVKGHRVEATADEEMPQPLSPELAAALGEPSSRPFHVLFNLLRKDGWLAPITLLSAAVLAAAGRILEALLIRGMLEIGQELGLIEQRIAAITVLLAFLVALVLLQAPLVGGLLRMGRRLEVRFRLAFLSKIPRLGDAYFRSRLVSDMAERSHSIHQIREMPSLSGLIVSLSFELLFTLAAVIWLDPAALPFVLLAPVAWLGIPLLSRSLIEEADLRARSLTGALSRFYLDGLLGLVPVRTHGASRSIRREHDSMLKEWVRAQTNVLFVQTPVAIGLQYLFGYPLLIWIVLSYVARGGQAEMLLLLVYWVINIHTISENLIWGVLRYPAFRNLTLRLLEPLGALEENDHLGAPTPHTAAVRTAAAAIHMQGVAVRAAGHSILKDIDLTIEPGEHVAIVGASGAGKTTLVSLLLGWHRAAAGEICVDGEPLDSEHLLRLRRETAWVDPSVQLWNRSMLDNLRYGLPDDADLPIGHVIEQADLLDVLGKFNEKYGAGLQMPLGENGGLVSGGEGQRVRLGRAMLRPNVRLVIMDEPFRGLERTERHTLLVRTRQFWQQATVICITHDVKETQAFDRVLVVDGGQIVEDDAPSALAEKPDSRYRALLDAEESVRVGLWSGALWRKLWMEHGRIAEWRSLDG